MGDGSRVRNRMLTSEWMRRGGVKEVKEREGCDVRTGEGEGYDQVWFGCKGIVKIRVM